MKLWEIKTFNDWRIYCLDPDTICKDCELTELKNKNEFGKCSKENFPHLMRIIRKKKIEKLLS